MSKRRETGYLAVIGLLTVALIGLVIAWSVDHREPGTASPPDQRDCGFAAGECGEGADTAPPPSPDDEDDLQAFRPIATVGDESVTRGDFYRYAGELYGSSILKQMLDDMALGLEAERLGITVGQTEIERELANMQQGYVSEAEFYRIMLEHLGMDREALERDIRRTLLLEKIATYDIVITDEALQDYLSERPEEVMAGTRLHIQQIIVQSEADAAEVTAQLEQGVPFEDMAAAYSNDPLFPNGDLGWIDWDDPFVAGPILEQARRMDPGEVSSVIALPDGTFAVIKLQDKQSLTEEERQRRLEQLRKELALSRAPNLQELLVQLRVRHRVTVIDPDFR